MLGLVQTFMLLGMLMLVLGVGVCRSPSRMLLVHFALLDVLNVFARISPIGVLIGVLKLVVMIHLLLGQLLMVGGWHLGLRCGLLVRLVVDLCVVIDLGQGSLVASFMER